MDPRQILKDEATFKKFAKTVFDSFDINGNGSIDKKELQSALVKFAKESGTTIPDDKNSSNTLTIDEFESFVRGVLIQMTS